MSQKSRHELLQILRQDYAQVQTQKQKTAIVNTVVNATGYNRKYAIALLHGREQPKPQQRQRPRKYDAEVVSALECLWETSNFLCGKRLAAFIPHALPAMERKGHLRLDEATRARLLEIAPATIDRLLKRARTGTARSAALTKHGAMLRKHIQVKTFAEWNDTVPGFLEVDTVAHAGGRLDGPFLFTLTLTDVVTGWTELVALPDKSDRSAIRGIERACARFPFPILGIDTDNGTEFMNYKLMNWCEKRSITFTRSREYKKNDQCFVEEKNGSVVRKLAGHARFSGLKSLEVLDNLYALAHSYVNFYQPSAKLVSKTRIGSTVRREYDVPKTPFERLVAHGIPKRTLRSLRDDFELLDPVRLLEDVRALQMQLLGLSSEREVVETLPTPKNTTARKCAGRGTAAQVASRVFELEHGEVISMQDIQHLGNYSSVYLTLQRLKEKGFLVHSGRGKWTRYDPGLTPEELSMLRVSQRPVLETGR